MGQQVNLFSKLKLKKIGVVKTMKLNELNPKTSDLPMGRLKVG